jgi:predicted RNA binding protein YcfA (HicA-like mRNA interferase family)
LKLPRDLAGKDLVQRLCRDWGYRRVHQVGSHVVLETDDPTHQRIVVPDHKTLRVGTLSGILRAVADHKDVDRRDLLRSLR